MSKRKFFCFNAASDSLYEDLRTLYCCRWHKFTLSSNSQYIYTFDIDMQLNNNNTECFVVFPLQQWLRGRATMLRNDIPIIPLFIVIIMAHQQGDLLTPLGPRRFTNLVFCCCFWWWCRCYSCYCCCCCYSRYCCCCSCCYCCCCSCRCRRRRRCCCCCFWSRREYNGCTVLEGSGHACQSVSATKNAIHAASIQCLFHLPLKSHLYKPFYWVKCKVQFPLHHPLLETRASRWQQQ